MRPPSRVRIEVALESSEDAQAAEAGGADRIELCAALDLGGLTPTIGTYLEVREACRLPVVVMIRPRPGDFVYSAAEVRAMLRDIELFGPHQPDGFVFGPLTADATVGTAAARAMLTAAGGVPCVFHRAFDRCRDAAEALNTLAEIGFRRILTSGGADTAVAGSDRLAEVVKLARGRVEILPCGRVRAESAVTVLQAAKCDQVHGSFAEPVPVGEGRGYRGYVGRSRTSRAEVAACRAALDEYARSRTG
jgi:copper homeostasis protein